MLMEVSLSEIMVKVALKIYLKYAIMSSRGKPILYVQIKVVVCPTTTHAAVQQEFGEGS